MWDLIVSVPDHCLSFCFVSGEKLAFCSYSVFALRERGIPSHWHLFVINKKYL